MGSLWTVLFLCTGFVSLWVTPSQGLDISYCSPDNNAGSYQGHYNEFQSNGACQQQCQGSFAFAVLQGYYCWCSNYVPAPQESTYNCNQQCPGFTSEWCGNTDSGLYGYYLLSAGVPLGTSGSTSNTPSTTSSPSSSPSSSVSIDASTSTLTSKPASASTYSLDTGSPTSSPASDTWKTASSVVTYGSSQSSDGAGVVTWSSDTSMSLVSSTTPTTPPPSTTDPPSTSSSPTPTEIYTSVTTVTGEVRTVVVTPSSAATSDATLGQSSTGGGGVSTGKVVGIVLGVALGIGGVIGTAVYLWFRRRHKKLQQEHGSETAYLPRTGDSSPSNNVPSRQVSQLSSSGLLGSKIPRINTSGVTLGNDLRSADTSSTGFDRRSLGTDQRLNPYALYIHDESRLSNVSLQDNQDYSRQLRVANPDP
ncbi:WSC domain-containing protein isoform 5 [Cladophialophora immunda]|nr:WSC domain-containing protein isoform 1 [Cladophialophora immunda]OQV03942.1 WSC domain-containing protein isoform 2 [Cladophialophora immunda]OQV03943.1 WSC domain-containing protein isoform 5 [Cladophialophora immunda]